MPVRLQTLCCLLLYVGIMACSPSKREEALAGLERVPLSYAKGFGIWQGEGYKVVEVSQAYPGKHEPFRYLVLEEGQPDYDPGDYDAVVTLPLNSIVLTSTTQVPHLDLLGISGLMTGFPNTDLISSAAMRRHIESGGVKDLGKGVLPNIETLIALDPDLMVVSTMGDNLQLVSLLDKAGIPAVLNGEYTEQDPLGRAEWIKFTGAVTGRYAESVEVFEEIESEYVNLKGNIAAATIAHKPAVMAGVMYNDIWYAPAASSWATFFLRDAGGDYIFKDETGTGSLQLSYEFVLDRAIHAEYWIGAADFKNLQHMKEVDPRYGHFKAFKKGEVYTFTKKKGPTGGLEYFELGYMRPDIILKDLVKILHPELLPDYEPYFYEKLN